jgi:hypothetical protein
MNYSDFIDADDLIPYVQSMNARAKALRQPGRVTVALLRDCIYASGGRCAWCGVSLVGQPIEIDHIMPLSRGGHNTADNLAVTCPTCNRRKGDRHPAYFAQQCALTTDTPAPLVQQMLAEYDVEALRQPSLFDDPSASDEVSTNTLSDDAPPTRPPYVWSDDAG